MIQLGAHLSNLRKADLKQALDELYNNYKSLIPRQDMLVSLAKTEDILNLEEWISTHDEFQPIVLDSGKSVPRIAPSS
jgi:hypothetical protein